MNKLQLDKVLQLESEEQHVYNMFRNTQKALCEAIQDFPDDEEIHKQLEQEVLFYKDELNKIKINLHSIVNHKSDAANYLTYSERIEAGYRDSECSYILVEDSEPEGNPILQKYQQCLGYGSNSKLLKDYSDEN